MASNISLARSVLQLLAGQGVREIVLCAGARNSPLVCLLEQANNIKIHFFFEERSAGFFALGRILSQRAPVAVVTTSGTAAAELLPATIEAHYSGLPLIAVTADRPRIYRGTGAPQAIEQVDLLRTFTETVLDIDLTSETPTLAGWSQQRPVHLNVCFDEPLLDEPLMPWDWQYLNSPSYHSHEMNLIQQQAMRDFLSRVKKPLVILSSLSVQEKQQVYEFLLRWRLPVYAEATSGLREQPSIQSFSLHSGEEGVSRLLSQGTFDGIIRIGGVPTLRGWRDLEKKFLLIPVLNISGLGFSGLAREKQSAIALSEGLSFLHEYARFPSANEGWKNWDLEKSTQLQNLLQAYPLAEPSLIRDLSQLISINSTLYIGNSLPIREWDLAASREYSHKVFANRGANGIDGQISTFLGLAVPDQQNWGLFGDLTTLYDLSGPWALRQLVNTRVQMVVINNRGGQIFSRLFKSAQVRNEHDLDFSHWAKMWRLEYLTWDSIPDNYTGNESTVIELRPDPLSTAHFWREYDLLWKIP